LLEEVIIAVQRHQFCVHLTMRWRGGAITQLEVPIPRFQPVGPRTEEDTIALLRRLAVLYPDEVIAGILNRQGRKPRPAGASRPTRSVVCAVIAIFLAFKRRLTQRKENWRRFGERRKS
jgi:hypothetical protein